MKFATLIFAIALCSSINCLVVKELWSKFKEEYSKEYSSAADEERRFNIFVENLDLINELQQLDENAEYGITKFSDLSPEEFHFLYLNNEFEPKSDERARPMPLDLSSLTNIPDTWDWRTADVVTPVKDQLLCLAGWAFAATGAIEGQYAIKHKVTYNFSEQMLIDCDTQNGRCFGSNGTVTEAYSWLAQHGGLEKSTDYPYFGVNLPCQMNTSYEVAYLLGFASTSQNETEIAQALYNAGPLSTAINSYWLQFYKGGILIPGKCSSEKLNHFVLLIGYGTDQDKKGQNIDYWLGKNSWGSNWGENGYFRIQRGVGACGLNLNVTYPLVQ